MPCVITEDKLMARIGPEKYEYSLKQEHATEINFIRKPLRGIIYVVPAL